MRRKNKNKKRNIFSSGSNITEYASQLEGQPIVDDISNHNPVATQTDDQHIVASLEISGQTRIGSTKYKRNHGTVSRLYFVLCL